MSNSKIEELRKLLPRKRAKHEYASMLGISVEEVKKLLKKIKEEETSPPSSMGGHPQNPFDPRISEVVNDIYANRKTVSVQSPHPLSPKEIEELAGVDRISTNIARVWLKSNDKGIWTYSIDLRFIEPGIYNRDELDEKLKELLPDYSPTTLPSTNRAPSQKALFVYIADDHVGAINENSIFGNSYTEMDYVKRLLRLCDDIVHLDQVYEKVVIVSLGDQMNGWNEQTTRGGHKVKSTSNREQFDAYVAGRRMFYDKLFDSGISSDYEIFNLDNSNHSGLGMSYMANKALQFYVEAKYPEVKCTSTTKPIDTYVYGKHVFAYTHGKDEVNQKIPFPKNITDKVDALFYQYFDKYGFSAYKNFQHVMKGDLHSYSVNLGKSCRYVNVPSIMGSSDYGEINFEDTKAGALLEIVSPNSPNIIHIPIKF